VIIDLALVNVLASVGERIKSKSDFAIAFEATWEVSANLVGIAGLLIG
jgi:hypothetical protein